MFSHIHKLKNTFHSAGAFLIALAAIVYIVNDVDAFSTTEKLSKLALIPTLPAVIPISENIDRVLQQQRRLVPLFAEIHFAHSLWTDLTA